ncbi:hypothetical protein GM539_15205, partial [Streptococcus pneumoniae]|nr:hypothetical protein [Streptococcus pneumoniae]
ILVPFLPYHLLSAYISQLDIHEHFDCVQYQGGNPGMSGGGIFNANGEVIGVHQNGAQNRSGGLILSPTQLAWIKSII